MVSGFPARFTMALFSKLRGSSVFGEMVEKKARCFCKVKTMVVPATGLSLWRDALACSPFGAAAVVEKAPYLGVTVAGLSVAPAPLPRPGLSPHCLALIRDWTWGACLTKVEHRVEVIAHPTSSPALLAANWNVFIVSCVPYPAQLVCPNAAILSRLRGALQRLLPTLGWLSASVLPACGALLAVQGRTQVPRRRGGVGRDHGLAPQ